MRTGAIRAWRRLLRSRLALMGLLVILLFTLLAVFATQLAPHEIVSFNLSIKLLPPAWMQVGAVSGDPAYPLGTDVYGRDVLSRLLHGTRTAMLTAALAVSLTALLGVLMGVISGKAGREVDLLLQRVVDIFQSFPQILFIVMFALVTRNTPFGLWGNGIPALSLAFAISGWAGLARLVRAAVLTLREQLFVEAARAQGASALSIIFRHILPNCLGLLLVWMTFAVPRAIIAEALIGYIGVSFGSTVEGREFAIFSWGGLFAEGRRAIHVQPILLLAPALCVTLVTSAFTFVGDALRDALDPRQG
jgi:ABC-type dipeptide/oligopeptide/nickel transport system permease subunit